MNNTLKQYSKYLPLVLLSLVLALGLLYFASKPKYAPILRDNQDARITPLEENGSIIIPSLPQSGGEGQFNSQGLNDGMDLEDFGRELDNLNIEEENFSDL